MKTVKHNDSCKMVFGRPSKHDDCPRCQELKSGQPARQGWSSAKKANDAKFELYLKQHNCKQAGCSIVCTFGDW